VECGESKGVVSLRLRKKCEGCKVKVRYRPNAKPCPLVCVGINMCVTRGGHMYEPTFGLKSDGEKRWCAQCGESKGVVSLRLRKEAKAMTVGI
jgi:hypothetical protein